MQMYGSFAGFHFDSALFELVPHGSLTLPVKFCHCERKVAVQPSFFRGYVKLRGCNIMTPAGE